MTQTASETPLDAELIDGEVVITAPSGFQSALTLEAAKASLSRLQRVVEAAGVRQETYQKPLG